MNTKRHVNCTMVILCHEHIPEQDTVLLFNQHGKVNFIDFVRHGDKCVTVQLDIRPLATMDIEHWKDRENNPTLEQHLTGQGFSAEFVRCIGFCIRCAYGFVRFETGAGEHPDLPTFQRETVTL